MSKKYFLILFCITFVFGIFSVAFLTSNKIKEGVVRVQSGTIKEVREREENEDQLQVLANLQSDTTDGTFRLVFIRVDKNTNIIKSGGEKVTAEEVFSLVDQVVTISYQSIWEGTAYFLADEIVVK